MSLESLNWLAVLAGALLNMLVGFLWYSPMLFGNLWLRLIGKRAEDIQAKTTDFVFSFLAALITAIVLAILVRGMGASTALEGLLLGAVIWIGIGATGTLVYSIFEGPPKSVWLLHGAYQLLVFALQGLLFAVWI
jgi:hypothetical protein